MGGPRQLVRIAGRFLIETIIRIDLSVSRKNVPMTSYMDTHVNTLIGRLVAILAQSHGIFGHVVTQLYLYSVQRRRIYSKLP